MSANRYCGTLAEPHDPEHLVFAAGQWSCLRHLTEQQRRRVQVADDAVRGRLGERGWPYGANVSVPTRERLAAWLLKHDLRQSNTSACLHWLEYGTCDLPVCRDYARRWMDHTSSWVTATHRVLVTHPYHLNAAERNEVEAVAEQHPNWPVDIASQGWYGNGTWQITLWAPRT